MTFEEWIVFILFTIAINVIFQTIAWKIGVSIGKKRGKEQ
mgnify:CR=1 FL=1